MTSMQVYRSFPLTTEVIKNTEGGITISAVGQDGSPCGAIIYITKDGKIRRHSKNPVGLVFEFEGREV